MLKHTENLILSFDDFDAKGNVKAASLMRAFEHVASVHAEKLGFGYEPMIAQNYIWVLSKLRFKLYGVLEAEKTYILETCPRPKKGVTWSRDYYIYDGEDLMAAGTSQWCIINFETRRIERTKLDFDGEFIDHEPFEDGIGKIRVNEEGIALAFSHPVTEDDLDINQHVNNCRYADIIEPVLSGHTDIMIHFAKEAVLGDEILIYTEENEGVIAVMGKLKDGTVIFQAKVI